MKRWMQYGLGIALCVVSAGVSAFVFHGSEVKSFLPFVLLGIVLFVAVKFGSGPGILGSIGAAIVFAEFLFHPILSLRVSDSAQRNNLLWMLLLGIVASELLGTHPQRRPPKDPSGKTT